MEHRRTCVACGTRFHMTGKYHGNYCSECHHEWLDIQRERPSDPLPVPKPRHHWGSRPSRPVWEPPEQTEAEVDDDETEE
ncbi:DUF7564 family protein [Haloarchaeobius sp. TZWSO28]|uniref:DUF7564 family protein n=1 Tax=Haloarchaeobius sp. TZWSO28 TaxID=3446119 RepID=UPI003EBF8129